MKQSTGGFALIVALSLVVVLAVVLVTYSTLTVGNARTSASSGNSTAGFYAAEASLNARAEQVRQKFKGFSTPSGTGPTTAQPCVGTNMGTGDYACQTASVGGRSVTSYARAQPSYNMTIPQGENFEYLTAQETPVTVYGQATGASGNPEAIASLVFRSRLVPLFQFAVFFDKDLEFTNTANLNLSGPVHTNGNLFLDAGSGATLQVRGQTTASVGIYRGWKHADSCNGTVTVADDGGTDRAAACSGARTLLAPSTMKATWGNQMKLLPVLEVPKVEDMQPRATATYWSKADVRIVLKRSTGSTSSSLTATWAPQFVRADGTQISGVTCAAVTGPAPTFYDNREAAYWNSTTGGNTPNRARKRLLEVDVQGLLTCLHANRTTLGMGPSGIANTSEGGLVVYLTVDDLKSGSALSGVLGGGTATGSISQGSVANNYGVRLRNGATLRSGNTSDPAPLGVTFVTDQALIVQGHYNKWATRAAGWIPSSLVADSINVLSQNWGTQQTDGCQYRVLGRTYFMTMTVPTDTTLATRWVRSNVDGEWYDSAFLSAADLANASTPGTAMTVTVNGGAQTWYGYRSGVTGVTSAKADDSLAGDARSGQPLFCRNVVPDVDADTGITSGSIVRAAILAGTSTTGNENALYSDPNMAQSGGVHNMMRFHEDWGANGNNPLSSGNPVDYVYSGSLVSLTTPLHAAGAFQRGLAQFYQPPRRVWGFDTQFRDAANLPPLTPRFVYLKQDNFTRQFEQP